MKIECVRSVRTCEAYGRSARVRLVGRRSRNFGIASLTNPSFPCIYDLGSCYYKIFLESDEDEYASDADQDGNLKGFVRD